MSQPTFSRDLRVLTREDMVNLTVSGIENEVFFDIDNEIFFDDDNSLCQRTVSNNLMCINEIISTAMNAAILKKTSSMGLMR